MEDIHKFQNQEVPDEFFYEKEIIEEEESS